LFFRESLRLLDQNNFFLSKNAFNISHFLTHAIFSGLSFSA
jgi:hypothetical protein